MAKAVNHQAVANPVVVENRVVRLKKKVVKMRLNKRLNKNKPDNKD